MLLHKFIIQLHSHSNEKCGPTLNRSEILACAAQHITSICSLHFQLFTPFRRLGDAYSIFTHTHNASKHGHQHTKSSTELHDMHPCKLYLQCKFDCISLNSSLHWIRTHEMNCKLIAFEGRSYFAEKSGRTTFVRLAARCDRDIFESRQSAYIT